ncbi:MAG TPA: metal-dependent transcriptional regulator [Gemmatimonadaceae bacterium]|nr:metal-dependent transcriptional regulator [Gemmatimonadaceae bacterium]
MMASREPEDYTAPVENYLKAIYEIERASGAAATTDIAQHLEIAPASVSGMIRRLAEQGLLEHERYRGVKLTDEGRRVALRTIRRHRVIESYLMRALGYPWDLVHDEAERLEHAASDELIDRMAAAIGEPTVDPHGAPIPTREGEIDERAHLALMELEPGEHGRVVQVSDADAGRLRYLGDLGLRPGARVTLLDRAPYGGPITLRVGSAKCQIGPALAAVVFVERAAGA